jgi:hypothetical protein
MIAASRRDLAQLATQDHGHPMDTIRIGMGAATTPGALGTLAFGPVAACLPER